MPLLSRDSHAQCPQPVGKRHELVKSTPRQGLPLSRFSVFSLSLSPREVNAEASQAVPTTYLSPTSFPKTAVSGGEAKLIRSFFFPLLVET